MMVDDYIGVAGGFILGVVILLFAFTIFVFLLSMRARLRRLEETLQATLKQPPLERSAFAEPTFVEANWERGGNETAVTPFRGAGRG